MLAVPLARLVPAMRRIKLMSIMKRAMGWMAVAALTCAAVGCAPDPAPRAVDHVDLDRYAGRWFEVARIPHPSDFLNVADTVEYTPIGHGKMGVVEQFHLDKTYGPECRQTGVLTADGKHDGKLKLRFGLTEGDYWILALDPDYRYALIGTPDRQWLRILARTPTLPLDIDENLYDLADRQGYNIAALQRTPQLMSAQTANYWNQ
jgi:apolipoprotein D and lipocalin family protein